MLLIIIINMYAIWTDKRLHIRNFKDLFFDKLEQGILYFIEPLLKLNIFFKHEIYGQYLYNFGECIFLNISNISHYYSK